MRTISRVSVFILLMAAAAPAQWLNYPTPRLPRTRDGKPNLAAPTPKAADGKPELSGIWLAVDGTHYRDLAKDMGPEGEPLQPWAKALSAQREDGVHKDDPRVVIQAAYL
jgi:hypothetical protein